MLMPEPLLPETFEPFGTVIETEGAERRSINNGNTMRYHALAEIDAGPNGTAILSIFRARRWPENELKMLERHPLASQTFVPLAQQDWLVVVAAGTQPTAEDCRCFHAFGDQGVQIAAGIWHHPLLILSASQEFLVIDRGEEEGNLERMELDPPAVLPVR